MPDTNTKIVQTDFSGGVYGKHGQRRATRIDGLEDSLNVIANYDNSLQTIPGPKLGSIDLLPTDKVLIFRHHGERYTLIYDTLCKRKYDFGDPVNTEERYNDDPAANQTRHYGFHTHQGPSVSGGNPRYGLAEYNRGLSYNPSLQGNRVANNGKWRPFSAESLAISPTDRDMNVGEIVPSEAWLNNNLVHFHNCRYLSYFYNAARRSLFVDNDYRRRIRPFTFQRATNSRYAPRFLALSGGGSPGDKLADAKKISGLDRDIPIGVSPLRVDPKTDSYAWTRFLIYNESGDIVCDRVWRPSFMDSDSGEVDKQEGTAFIVDGPNDGIPKLRADKWGTSDLSYSHIVGDDRVILYDNKGVLPTIVLKSTVLSNGSLAFLASDIRLSYYEDIIKPISCVSWRSDSDMRKLATRFFQDNYSASSNVPVSTIAAELTGFLNLPLFSDTVNEFPMRDESLELALVSANRYLDSPFISNPSSTNPQQGVSIIENRNTRLFTKVGERVFDLRFWPVEEVDNEVLGTRMEAGSIVKYSLTSGNSGTLMEKVRTQSMGHPFTLTWGELQVYSGLNAGSLDFYPEWPRENLEGLTITRAVAGAGSTTRMDAELTFPANQASVVQNLTRTSNTAVSVRTAAIINMWNFVAVVWNTETRIFQQIPGEDVRNFNGLPWYVLAMSSGFIRAVLYTQRRWVIGGIAGDPAAWQVSSAETGVAPFTFLSFAQRRSTPTYSEDVPLLNRIGLAEGSEILWFSRRVGSQIVIGTDSLVAFYASLSASGTYVPSLVKRLPTSGNDAQEVFSNRYILDLEGRNIWYTRIDRNYQTDRSLDITDRLSFDNEHLAGNPITKMRWDSSGFGIFEAGDKLYYGIIDNRRDTIGWFPLMFNPDGHAWDVDKGVLYVGVKGADKKTKLSTWSPRSQDPLPSFFVDGDIQGKPLSPIVKFFAPRVYRNVIATMPVNCRVRAGFAECDTNLATRRKRPKIYVVENQGSCGGVVRQHPDGSFQPVQRSDGSRDTVAICLGENGEPLEIIKIANYSVEIST